MRRPTIILDGKKWIIIKIYLTDLDFLYVRLFDEKTRTYMNWRVGSKWMEDDNFFLDLIRKK